MTDIIANTTELAEYSSVQNEEQFYESLNRALILLNTCITTEMENAVLIASGGVAFDKGITNFWNEMAKKYKLVLMSEVTAEYRRYTKMKIKFPFFTTPHLLAKDILVPRLRIKNQRYKRKCCSKRCMDIAVDIYKKRHLEIGDGYAEALMKFASIYICNILDKIKPKIVILWNEFYSFHLIFKEICEKKHIKIFYMEFGNLPGTFTIEEKGQMGESVVSRKPYRFNSLKIDSDDIFNAINIWSFLIRSRLNRNVQPHNIISRNLIDYKKKTILYTGQNDYESGMMYGGWKTKAFHSPMFKTTLEALEYLSVLALKNDWNLIFKPHPLMVAWGHCKPDKKLENVKQIDMVDINEIIDVSDVVISVFSQSAYVALIRNKPVVIMGYCQLKRSGCVYEAYKYSDIEAKIKAALRLGFTAKQKEKYINHIARMTKYYLYDDLTDREIRFGKAIDNNTLGGVCRGWKRR